MTNLTPEIIESATDEQLAELVAVHCIELHIESGFYGIHPIKYWANKNGDNAFPEFNQPPTLDGWQPHLSTEKGKAQAIDLAERYKGMLDFHNNSCRFGNAKIFYEKSWQIAVLKACLYAEMER